jgi:hypothetical protein
MRQLRELKRREGALAKQVGPQDILRYAHETQDTLSNPQPKHCPHCRQETLFLRHAIKQRSLERSLRIS